MSRPARRPPFRRILVANRGEIACRVLRSAHALGIRTVAVYSEADRGALHVRLADEAVCAGPAAAARSYLDIERIVAACRERGAEAVHPGYGFLSENPRFARALEEAGVVFIGPGARAMTAMGDKLASKRIAAEAGVNLVPGHDAPLADADAARDAARRIGYPVMLKASAGGGGKGMRVVHGDEECAEGFERARSEARASFGDDRVLVEKFIEEPRHVEVQVLADGHGNVVHLGDRECSIQRRHQKVIEESPAPHLDEAVRRAMGEQAVALARAVGYRSAGTVEFIVDPAQRFYFLEMNTRLQVEHPVTEYVTGLDLVALMIRIAAGEPLPFTQDEVRLRGSAVEVRVCAEDATRGFVPCTGRVVRWLPPRRGRHVRLDSGVEEGSAVSVHYDPLLAKLITGGATRAAAIERMRSALDAFHVRGVTHNLRFLAALVGHPRFRAGRLSTRFIDEEYPQGFDPGRVPPAARGVLLAVAAAVHTACSGRLARRPRRTREWVVLLEGEPHPVRVARSRGGWRIGIGGRTHVLLSAWRPGDVRFRGRLDGAALCVQVERRGIHYRLGRGGVETQVTVVAPRVAELMQRMPEAGRAETAGQLCAPMAGRLLRISVRGGDRLRAGQAVAVLEAMKMEHTVRAEAEGTVAELLADAGATLAAGQPILRLR